MSDSALKPHSLKEWLSFLDRLNPDRMVFGLERVVQVLERLGTNDDCLFIEVAGTNGKGSTATLIAGACVNAGIKTGLYTSPHLYSFTERVKVDGQSVDEQLLAESFSRVETVRGNIPLTYFEYTTLAALDCFRRSQVKVAVLEIGLGGRLDAVNAVDAKLAVITSIGLDHMNILGNTEEQIAAEKAGIIKSGSLVVTGRLSAGASKVIRARADELGVPVWSEGVDFSFNGISNGGIYEQRCSDGYSYLLKTARPLVPECCVAAALCALNLLQTKCQMPLNDEAILRAVSTVSLPGRMQQISSEPDIILDVAHNVPAAVHLRSEIEKRTCKGRRIACVGMLKDKDIEGVMQVMSDCFERFYLVTLHTERGAMAQRLSSALMHIDNFKASVRTYQEFNQALKEALGDLNAEDELWIFGSFVTVSLAGKYFGLNK